MLQFGVAIIYYNPKESVINQLDTYAEAFSHILAVDNSEKKSEVLEEIKEYSRVTYLDMGGNQGMSIALNRAFEWAKEQNLDYILTMDQDSRYPLEDIKIMMEYIEKNQAGDVAIYGTNFSKLYWDKKKNRKVSAPPIIPRNEVREISMCLTSGSYVNVRIIEEILPLENLFIALVDNSMSTELLKRGYRILRVGAACFEQQVGELVQNTWWNRNFRIVHHTEIRYYYTNRNIGYYCKKYGKDKRVMIQGYIWRLRLVFNILVAEPQKIKKLKACISGRRDYKKGICGKILKSSITWE